MPRPKPQLESEWADPQGTFQKMRSDTPAQEPSPAPINPERIHDAAGLKIVILVVVLGTALAIAWVAQNKTAQNRSAPIDPTATPTQEIAPSQGVTVTSGPQHASRKAVVAKPPQKTDVKPGQK
jgi:hypothetical protein